MPKCKMLVNANFDQLRVAIVGDKGLLEQVDFESLHNTNNLGNIYRAVITAIEPSLQAAFVDYGGHRHGFLPFNEIHPRYYSGSDRGGDRGRERGNERERGNDRGDRGDRRASTGDRLRVGSQVIIQVAREEIGLKGAYMTTFLSLPGQYLVMMPLTSKVGISRKIENQEDRRSVRDLLEQISVPEGMGYIIRTAGLGKTREQLQRDLNLLTTTWAELEARAAAVKVPTLLYQEDDVVTRTIRDYYNEDVAEVLVDDKDVYETVLSYFKKVMPKYAHAVKCYQNKTPLFTRHRIDEQVDSIFASKIILPSGGSIVIEQTEALVVIDVNSGKTAEGNLEATALKSNLEAAEEVARQLRLRDLGGLVVIDFIDLREKRHSLDVENRLRDCLKKDKARITVTGLSRFGLLEMSRQRINTSKEIRHYVDCVHCQGVGRVKSLDMQALDLLRRAKIMLGTKPAKELKVTCSEELGIHLLNERRIDITSLETEFKAAVRIVLKQGHTIPSFDITKRPLQEENKDMVMPPPLSLSTMAASMTDKAINEQIDYREEKLESLEKMTFEELRAIDIPTPQSLNAFERFNFSVRVTLMKRHGIYENHLDAFKEAIQEGISKGTKKGTEDEDELINDEDADNDDLRNQGEVSGDSDDEDEGEGEGEGDNEGDSDDVQAADADGEARDPRGNRGNRGRRGRGRGRRGGRGRRNEGEGEGDDSPRRLSPELLAARAKNV